MNNVYLMDYKNNKHDTGIPVDKVVKIYVKVISGDEVADIYFRNAMHTVDVSVLNGIPRLHDYFDMDYTIDKSEIEEWNKRKDTYDWPLWDGEV